MRRFHRENTDDILFDEKSLVFPLMKSDFYTKLSDSDKELFDTLIKRIPDIDYDGYSFEEEAVLFPYF